MPGEIEWVLQSTDTSKLDKSLEDADKRIEQTERKARITVSNIILSLKLVTDVAALVAVSTGEKIDVSFLMMTQMMASSLMSLKAQIAVYAATPGGWAFAVMLGTMIPMITATMMWIQGEQMKSRARMEKINSDQVDSILDSFTY